MACNWHVGMLEAGQSQNWIARHFGKSKNVISQLVSQYWQTGGVKIRDGRGWPKKTTPRQDRYLSIFALRNRFISAPEWRDTFSGVMWIRLSKSMIHNRLHGVGLKAKRLFKGRHLTRADKRLRNQWEQRHHRAATALLAIHHVLQWIKMLFEIHQWLKMCLGEGLGEVPSCNSPAAW